MDRTHRGRGYVKYLRLFFTQTSLLPHPRHASAARRRESASLRLPNAAGFRRRRGAGWCGLVLAELALNGAALLLIATGAIRLIKSVGLVAHFEACQEFHIAWHGRGALRDAILAVAGLKFCPFSREFRARVVLVFHTASISEILVVAGIGPRILARAGNAEMRHLVRFRRSRTRECQQSNPNQPRDDPLHAIRLLEPV